MEQEIKVETTQECSKLFFFGDNYRQEGPFDFSHRRQTFVLNSGDSIPKVDLIDISDLIIGLEYKMALMDEEALKIENEEDGKLGKRKPIAECYEKKTKRSAKPSRALIRKSKILDLYTSGVTKSQGSLNQSIPALTQLNSALVNMRLQAI